MKHDPYLQFPLCALAFGEDIRTRLNTILDYAVIEAGSRLFRKLPPTHRQEFISNRQRDGKLAYDYKPNDWNQNAAMYGAFILGVSYPDYSMTLKRHGKLATYLEEFVKIHGKDALVRIKQQWFFKARDGNGISYREFSVLCAIYSALGDKRLAIITRDRIGRCALGYRKKAILDAELSRRTDKAKPLTERQLRDTIDRLHRNKFFARATVSRRFTYYSIRLDNEALRKEVLKRRSYPAYFNATRSAQDQALTAAINQQNRKAAAMITLPPLGGP